MLNLSSVPDDIFMLNYLKKLYTMQINATGFKFSKLI